MNAPLATVAVSDDGDTLTIALRGEIDVSNADALGEDIRRRIAIRGPAEVVVDLTAVEYLDSRGVLLLMRLAAQLRDGGVPLRVVAPAQTIAGRLLVIAGFQDYFSDQPAL